MMIVGYRIMLTGCVAMLSSTVLTQGQSLMNARMVGLGAGVASVRDSRGFAANPAGLVNLKDWDFTTTTYAAVSQTAGGFVFHGLSFGKKAFESEAIAMQYAPGTSLIFVSPLAVTIGTTSQSVSNDREIEYTEPLSIGYAHKFSSALAVGLGGRYRREKVSDTQYDIQFRDSITVPVISRNIAEATTWFLDLGLTWNPSENVTIGLVGRNLLRLPQSALPAGFESYRLPYKPIGETGISILPSPSFRVAVEITSLGSGRAGHEWNLGKGFTVRNALFMDRRESPFLYALSAGVGWSYDFLEVDAAYLRFVNQDRRSGAGLASDFDSQRLANLDLNQYTADRISLSVKAVFGNVRASLARIESVEMLDGVYPSAYEVLAYKPIGKARIRNISSKPIEVKASFFVERYMDAPTESQPMYILPNEEADVPLTAVFNDLVRRVPRVTIKDASVTVHATPAEQYDDRYQARLLIHGKNDWDGDVLTLRYFVTPDDPDVLRYSRDILLQNRDSLSQLPRLLEPFQKAKTLIGGFAGKLLYVNDPKQSADYVQYPSETLRLKGGDCDDMTVCFASLLSSIGISTAFVNVVPPGHPEKGHIYLLFDTGLDPKFGRNISENPKRYIIRKGKIGNETIWLPIETTVIARGFEESWSTGAQEYFDDVEIGLGQVKGWVRIVDVY